MVGNKAARKTRQFQPIERVIIVDFKIKHAGIGNLGIVDLDFIGLSKCLPRPSNEQYRNDSGNCLGPIELQLTSPK